jgi:hypothetical protein
VQNGMDTRIMTESKSNVYIDAADAELLFSRFSSLMRFCVKDVEGAVPAVVCHVEAASTLIYMR